MDVELNYTGRLTDGTQFDSNVERQEPLIFRVGYAQMIRGFDKGVIGMKEGGERQITIPPELGYGTRGGGAVPPNATLIFDVYLIKVRK